MEKLDIIVESVNGLHITMASVSNEAHGALVAEALYYYLQTTPPSTTQARFVWLRDMTSGKPHLLRAWPEEFKDAEGWKASVAAWKVSPRGVSGDESEPDAATAREAIETILATLPERYQPLALTYANQRFTLMVDHGTVYRDKPAREAIHLTNRYVREHEKAGWTLPTGVVNGIYD